MLNILKYEFMKEKRNVSDMKNGKVFLIIIGIILCVLVIITIFSSLKKQETPDNTEITPGEEMTEEQERQTIISLYYIRLENNALTPEARVIDAKNLLENPYKTLTEYLIEGPKNDKLQRVLPNGTKVNGATRSGDMVLLDLSQEFIQDQSEEAIKMGINSIVNTLTELNDVNSVKVLINGEEGKKIEGTEIDFSKAFFRQESVT